MAGEKLTSNYTIYKFKKLVEFLDRTAAESASYKGEKREPRHTKAINDSIQSLLFFFLSFFSAEFFNCKNIITN